MCIPGSLTVDLPKNAVTVSPAGTVFYFPIPPGGLGANLFFCLTAGTGINKYGTTSPTPLYSYPPPVIYLITPSSATPGSSLVLTGANLGSLPLHMVVMIGGVNAPLTSCASDGTSVTVTVPSLVGLSLPVIMTTFGQKSSGNATFSLPLPAIATVTMLTNPSTSPSLFPPSHTSTFCLLLACTRLALSRLTVVSSSLPPPARPPARYVACSLPHPGTVTLTIMGSNLGPASPSYTTFVALLRFPAGSGSAGSAGSAGSGGTCSRAYVLLNPTQAASCAKFVIPSTNFGTYSGTQLVLRDISMYVFPVFALACRSFPFPISLFLIPCPSRIRTYSHPHALVPGLNHVVESAPARELPSLPAVRAPSWR